VDSKPFWGRDDGEKEGPSGKSFSTGSIGCLLSSVEGGDYDGPFLGEKRASARLKDNTTLSSTETFSGTTGEGNGDHDTLLDSWGGRDI